MTLTTDQAFLAAARAANKIYSSYKPAGNLETFAGDTVRTLIDSDLASKAALAVSGPGIDILAAIGGLDASGSAKSLIDQLQSTETDEITHSNLDDLFGPGEVLVLPLNNIHPASGVLVIAPSENIPTESHAVWQEISLAITNVINNHIAVLEFKSPGIVQGLAFAESLVEAAPIPVFCLDNKMLVTVWNKACQEFTGIKKEQIIGSNGYGRAYPDEIIEALAERILSSDKSKSSKKPSKVKIEPSNLSENAFQARGFYTDTLNRDKTVQFTAVAVNNFVDQQPAVAIMVLDMTERTRLEWEVVSSNTKYREMTEQAFDGIVIHNNQTIDYANKKFQEMFGRDPSESAKGEFLHSYLAPQTQKALLEAQRSIELEGNRPIINTGRGLRADGRFLDIELSTFATTFDQRPVFQTIIRDVSGSKPWDGQMVLPEKSDEAGEVLFKIVHEVNNPLAGIIAYTHLLLEEMDGRQTLNPETVTDLREILNKVLTLGNRCKTLVEGLLDYARTGHEAPGPIDLSEIIKETLSLLEGHALLAGIEVVQALEPGSPKIIGDAGNLSQVIMNLVLNGAEAMQGKGRLSIMTAVNRERDKLHLYITDTGKGIAEENIEKIFEPFFSTKPKGRGTGLGLAITKEIINQHGGIIEVKSQIDRGSSFIITLPTE